LAFLQPQNPSIFLFLIKKLFGENENSQMNKIQGSSSLEKASETLKKANFEILEKF